MTDDRTMGNGGGDSVVAVATGSDAGSAASSALSLLGGSSALPADATVLLPSPPAPETLRLAVRALAGAGAATERPRTGLGRLGIAVDAWRIVPLAAGARRFDGVMAPSRLLDRPLLLACPLPTGPGSPTPIGLLAAFAHPRQRLAARFGGDSGALAELAAPLQPKLVLLAGRTAEGIVAVLTRDLIAAELVARALLQVEPDAPGPWEHPVVQRATELDLGARAPIAVRFVAADEGAEAFLRPVRPRVGVG